MSHRSRKKLKEVLRLLKRIAGATDPIGLIAFKQTGEDNNMLGYKVTLPTLDPNDPQSKDVVKGLLRLVLNDTPQPDIETAPGQLVIDEFPIEQGTSVAGDFVFVDDAGNLSKNPVAIVPFTASDTIPPPNPIGGVGFENISET